MAIFILRGIYEGNNFQFSSTPHFADVAPGDFGFNFIQATYELKITKGCGNNKGVLPYCPNDSVTRLQMAVFIIRAQLGVATVFDYPATAYFTDVLPPASDPTDINFRYVQRMKMEGITPGCGVTTY